MASKSDRSPVLPLPNQITSGKFFNLLSLHFLVGEISSLVKWDCLALHRIATKISEVQKRNETLELGLVEERCDSTI